MAGLNALFNTRQLKAAYDQFQQDVDAKVIQGLQYVGEAFVNNARSIDTYKDRTGNLRASIGYVIMAHGNIVQSNFQGPKTGQDEGKVYAQEVAANYPHGYVLIGVAGMHYAAYVEAKGHDVITGSAPTKGIIQDILKDL